MIFLSPEQVDGLTLRAPKHFLGSLGLIFGCLAACKSWGLPNIGADKPRRIGCQWFASVACCLALRFSIRCGRRSAACVRPPMASRSESDFVDEICMDSCGQGDGRDCLPQCSRTFRHPLGKGRSRIARGFGCWNRGANWRLDHGRGAWTQAAVAQRLVTRIVGIAASLAVH